jgi:hypothetical protein
MFALALISIYVIARLGSSPMRQEASMQRNRDAEEIVDILKRGSELAGVAAAMDVYQRIAQTDTVIAAYRNSTTRNAFTTVATGTSPNAALIVPRS